MVFYLSCLSALPWPCRVTHANTVQRCQYMWSTRTRVAWQRNLSPHLVEHIAENEVSHKDGDQGDDDGASC